jgi:hypothetical protein
MDTDLKEGKSWHANAIKSSETNCLRLIKNLADNDREQKLVGGTLQHQIRFYGR